MARRQGFPLYGKRYCGNTNKMEVHDLDNETSQSQIDEIIAARHARNFTPDTLEQAHSEGFDNCHYCIGGSQR
jgi:hypothetical protein